MIRLNAERSSLRRMRADAVAVFVNEEPALLREEISGLRKILGKRIDKAVELEKFAGKEGEVLALFTDGAMASPRLFVVGLGKEKPDQNGALERYRRGAALAAKQARASKAKRLAFAFPSDSTDGALRETSQALLEGAALALYSFNKYFTEKEKHERTVQEVTLFSEAEARAKEIKKSLHETRIVCEAVSFARDLENAPGNEVFPETLADAARKSALAHGYRAEVWDKKRVERIGFGGLLAVNSGSDKPPRFIILEHNSGRKDLDTIVLVGKGITFDSGGISIKPAAAMAEMKMDMSGAAAVIGTLEAASRLDLPVHLVGLIPATENLLGGSALKPGDIIRHYGGKTSEVDNTDAEGRLVLADALVYASTYKPKAVIDLATLTGACVVALGHHATGMMGNDESLMAALKTAGEATYERVWELPMFDEYNEQIKSDVADVKNVGGRWAGAITAALFLKKFVGEYKWVHLDIAGTAILEESLPYAPRGGSGVGVRLLVQFLKNWNSA